MKYKEQDFDIQIQEAYKSLINDIPDPDVKEALIKLKKKKARRKINNVKLIAATAAVILSVILLTMSGPAQAIKKFIQVSYNRVTGETTNIIQKGEQDGDNVGGITEPDSIFYNNISSLQSIKTPGIYIPGEELKEKFISTEVTNIGERIVKVTIKLNFDEKIISLDQSIKYGEWGAGYGTDTDDALVEEKKINGINVTVTNYKGIYTKMVWYQNNIEFELSGDVTPEDLELYADELQLFN